MNRKIVAAFAVLTASSGFTCGGTSGTENLPSAAADSSVSEGGNDGAQDAPIDAISVIDATNFVDGTTETGAALDGGAPLDATVSDALYIGTFDVAIQYADRALPDVSAAPEAGGMMAEAGPALPACPPFLPVSLAGTVIDLSLAADEVPAVYGPDGGEVLAPDGSVCATYPWLGSVGVDQCVTQRSEDFIYLPPCSWAVDAGLASTGPGAGQSRYDLCIALYQCFMRTSCYLAPNRQFNPDSSYWCFCGAGTTALGPECASNPQGACKQEELASMEIDPTVPPSTVVQLFHTTGLGPGLAGRMLNYLFFEVSGVSDCKSAALALLDGGIDASH